METEINQGIVFKFLLVEDKPDMARIITRMIKAGLSEVLEKGEVTWVTGFRSLNPLEGMTDNGGTILLAPHEYHVAVVDGEIHGPYQGPSVVSYLVKNNIFCVACSGRINHELIKNGAQIACEKHEVRVSIKTVIEALRQKQQA